MQFWSASRILLPVAIRTIRSCRPRKRRRKVGGSTSKGWAGMRSCPTTIRPGWRLALVPLVPLGYGLAKCCVAGAVDRSGARPLRLSAAAPRCPALPRRWRCCVTAGFGVWWITLPIGQTAPLVVLLLVASWRLAEAGTIVAAGAIAGLAIDQTAIGAAADGGRAGLGRAADGAGNSLLAGPVAWRCWWARARASSPGWLPAMLDAPHVTPLVTAENPWMGATWFCLLRSISPGGRLCCGRVCGSAPCRPPGGAVDGMAAKQHAARLARACLLGRPLVAPYARYYDLALMLVPLVVLARRPLASQRAGCWRAL